MRGSKALTAIISNDLTIVAEKHQKGCFTDQRDDALACRFFYHGHLIGKRYDICLRDLSKEFFLSETVIGQRLIAKQAFLKELRQNSTNRKHLQLKYPHFNWH
jgi:hypothetical protein